MIRIERACIDLMMNLKKCEDIEKELKKFKNLVFKQALEAVFGPKVWEKIENLKQNP